MILLRSLASGLLLSHGPWLAASARQCFSVRDLLEKNWLEGGLIQPSFIFSSFSIESLSVIALGYVNVFPKSR